MKYLKWIPIILLFWISNGIAQPAANTPQELIEHHKTLYDNLTQELKSTVESYNTKLRELKQSFQFDASLLHADSINHAIEPGEIDFPLPFDENDVLLIIDRLKMRNNSVNQINYILSNDQSYLSSLNEAFNAKQKQYDESLKAAEKRFKETESWGNKRFWRGLGYGLLSGAVIGFVVGGVVF